MPAEQQHAATAKSKKQMHRKDKPWDTADVDHWRIEKFTSEHSSGHVLEESSFMILFPKYRETYLREVWPQLTRILDGHGVACVLDLVQGSMTVKTTRKMHDPYIIIKARDVLKLLARSVPLPNAARVLEDGVAMDIIKIGNILGNKERFVKRRMRLIGPSGNTLKAIELLTTCFMLVQGNTVAAVGGYKSLKEVRRIVIDCMKNIHPIYHIKELMIKRELAKDEKLKSENWDRFLPKFKKNIASSKKPSPCRPEEQAQNRPPQGPTGAKKKTIKNEYTPFPPPQQPRKEDHLLESGEYFLRPQEIKKRKAGAIKAKKDSGLEKRKTERQKRLVPPEETPYARESKP